MVLNFQCFSQRFPPTALGAVGSVPLKTAALASTTYETHGKEFVSSTFLIFS